MHYFQRFVGNAFNPHDNAETAPQEAPPEIPERLDQITERLQAERKKLIAELFHAR